MGLYRQEYWSGLPFPSPGDLPVLGIKPMSPALQIDSLPSEPPENPMPPCVKLTGGLLSAHCRITVPLASGVYTLVSEVGSEVVSLCPYLLDGCGG